MHATDKHGHQLVAGDTVHFPYGGDMHTATVAEIDEQLGTVVIHATIMATVPARIATKLPHTPITAPAKPAPRRRSAQ
jgi:hypothetical protein